MLLLHTVVIASTQVYSRIFLLIFLMLHNDIICSILHHRRRRRCVLVYFLTVIPWFYTFIMAECGKTTVKRFVRIILFVLVWNGSIIRVRKLSNLVHRCNIRRGGPPTRRPSIMAAVSCYVSILQKKIANAKFAQFRGKNIWWWRHRIYLRAKRNLNFEGGYHVLGMCVCTTNLPLCYCNILEKCLPIYVHGSHYLKHNTLM